jgi:hypothetical protein
MLARIGVMWAINRHIVRMFDPSRKEKHGGRRATRCPILAQDAELKLASFRSCRAGAS